MTRAALLTEIHQIGPIRVHAVDVAGQPLFLRFRTDDELCPVGAQYAPAYGHGGPGNSVITCRLEPSPRAK